MHSSACRLGMVLSLMQCLNFDFSIFLSLDNSTCACYEVPYVERCRLRAKGDLLWLSYMNLDLDLQSACLRLLEPPVNMLCTASAMMGFYSQNKQQPLPKCRALGGEAGLFTAHSSFTKQATMQRLRDYFIT